MPVNSPQTEKNTDKEKPSADAAPIEKQLFDARVVLISAPVDAKLSVAVNAKLLALERVSDDPITVFINSPGGEIHSGFAIFDTIRFITPKVYTVVTGLAASMGSILAISVPKERRFAFPNSKFLIHQPLISGGLGGSVSEIEIHAKDLLDTKEKLTELYCKETGRTAAEVKKALDRDTWMSPQQALEFGLISKIITTRKELPK